MTLLVLTEPSIVLPSLMSYPSGCFKASVMSFKVGRPTSKDAAAFVMSRKRKVKRKIDYTSDKSIICMKATQCDQR